ncbi:hypothetical protein INS49_007719 [Diaporthe citri]|uniref:uncharacterized protein n=1 Tax=Diaporthe citri TaxID=83186 RepID=UPI001C8014A8|nr:uncharacterized protein INS49_007719 [Diaporthe citri]KAG6362627.1 hypothetical protein INS49_007719 [Diaporthe citri]
MSEADSKTIHVNPQVQTPPPRAYLSSLMPGNTVGVPLPADNMNAPAAGATAINQARNQDTQKPFPAIPDEEVEEADWIARWLEKTEMEQADKYNRTVTISPLPDDATVADVLPRIRGGVDSCYVSQFEETRVAVVTFKRSADAITYADFCKETPIWGLWTFQISRPGVPFTWERRAKVKLYKAAPGMGSVWKRGDIPTQPRDVVVAGSRCLKYTGCKPHEVANIYRALGLQYSQHQRDQVEGMWLDGPVRDGKGDPVRGTLHVWYTSIKAAQEAKVRVTSLEFEYDPCSDSPEKLLLYLDEGDDVPIFRHHEPFVNLVDLDQKSILTGIREGLVDPAQAYWRCRVVTQPKPDVMDNLAARLQWSLQTNGGRQAMSTFPGAYQQPGVIIPPAALSDPFLDTQPIGTGFPPQHNRDIPVYRLPGIDQNIPTEYQPFAASRAVPPGHHLSPLETYVARTQERQALGFPPYHNTDQNSVLYRTTQPVYDLTTDTDNKNNNSSSDGTGTGTFGGIGVIGDNIRTTNTNLATNNSNLGGGDDDTRTNLTDAPQDIQVPGDSAPTTVFATSLISDSSSLTQGATYAVSLQTSVAGHKMDHGYAGNSSKEVCADNFGTGSNCSIEPTVVGLRGGGKATKSDKTSSTDTSESVDAPLTSAPGKYSRKDLSTQDVFWTCSLEEFRAMSDEQWASFGTAFYVAPAGFDTATKHVVQLE